MSDDLLEELFEEVGLELKGSKRVQTIGRIFFGVLGTLLAGAGAWHIVLRGEAGAHLRAGGAAMFALLGAFFLFNVCLLKPWRWPGFLFLGSLGMLFVLRIAFGP